MRRGRVPQGREQLVLLSASGRERRPPQLTATRLGANILTSEKLLEKKDRRVTA